MPRIRPRRVSVSWRMLSSGEVALGRISNIEVTGPSEDVRLRLPLAEAGVACAHSPCGAVRVLGGRPRRMGGAFQLVRSS
jgi:hypothetical protein